MAERVDIVEREGLGLAIIQARRGVDPAAIGRALGIDLPTSAGRAGNDAFAAIATGPDTWFLLREKPEPDWTETLGTSLDGLAAVFDQSSGYTVLKLGGEGARTLLQSGTPIDLDPVQFGPLASASTAIAHIVVLIWRADSGPDFNIAFYRSFRASLEHWLTGARASDTARTG